MAGQSCQGGIAVGVSGPCAPPKQWDPAGTGAGDDASHAPSPPAAPLSLAPSLREGNLTWRLLVPSELMEKKSTRYFFFLFSLGGFSTELQLTLAACSGCQRCSPGTAMQGRGHRRDVGIWSQRINTSLNQQLCKKWLPRSSSPHFTLCKSEHPDPSLAVPAPPCRHAAPRPSA